MAQHAETDLDEAIVGEIQSRPEDFFELVSYEVASLLSEESDVSTLRPHWDRVANFLPPGQVPYREEGYTALEISQRLRRLMVPAIQTELDQVYFGRYSSAFYREQLSGKRPISDLSVVAWPRLNRTTNDCSTFTRNIANNPVLEDSPRVVVASEHLNRTLLDQTTRVVGMKIDEEAPFPEFIFRPDPGHELTVHFQGGTVDALGGRLLRQLLGPSLAAKSVAKVRLNLRAQAAYVLPPAEIPMWEVRSQFLSVFEVVSAGHRSAEQYLKDFTAALLLTEVHYAAAPVPTLRGFTREGVPFEAALEFPR